MILNTLTLGIAFAALAPLIQAQNAPVKNIVLVHGAWADGSGWKNVSDILVRDGYNMLGPFADPDGAPAVYVGMFGVAGMATQNALVKLALPGSPSTALLTTNTTLLGIDLATLAHARSESAELVRARRRASVVLLCIVGFVIGCAAGVFLEMRLHLSALAMPLGLAVLAIPLGELWPDETADLEAKTHLIESLK